MNLNWLVQMFLGTWIQSKVDRIKKEYKTVAEAKAGFHAKLKDSRIHWIPGDIRKRAEQWVDRMADRSATVDDLVANMQASLEAGFADVAAAVHPA